MKKFNRENINAHLESCRASYEKLVVKLRI